VNGVGHNVSMGVGQTGPMSPVSRGRKPKKNTQSNTGKRTRRGRSLFTEADLPVPGCDCPVCGGEDVDSTGLIDSLLDDAASLLASEDPLDAEVAGAVLASTVTLAVGQIGLVDDLAGDHVLVEGLIPALEARASTEAMALLLALGSVAHDPVSAAASAAGQRLAHADVTRPSWADELTTPVAIGQCQRLVDPAGTGAILAASFARAGRSHAVLVWVDGLDCAAAAEIALLDADELPDALAVIRSTHSDPAGASGDFGEVLEETLDVTEWRWQVENALDARAVHDHTDGLILDGLDLRGVDLDFDNFRLADLDDKDENDDEEQDELASYPALALLLRARLAAIPASSKPKPPHGGHDDSPTIDITALAHALQQLTGGAAGRNRSANSGPGQGAKLPAKRARENRPAPIYQIKIGIRHTKPPIWRRLQLSADTSLATLHNIIQIAFGWDDYHLHLFHTPYGEFGQADANLGHRAEAPVTLEQVAPTAGDKIAYTYDFGDDWNLDIIVEKLLAPEPATSYPRCIGGRRAAPPEDSGGIWGYENLIKALADSDHPDHDDMLDWLGYTNATDFDPAHFDPHAITQALSRRR
jgi:Plasmid pRiA4b ORF-3-like protein